MKYTPHSQNTIQKPSSQTVYKIPAASITRSDKWWYASGSIALAIKNVTFNMFLLLYYKQVLGLSGSLTGLALFITVLWDAISDPLIGAWSDQLKTRIGRRHPLLILGTIPLGLSFIMIFSPIEAVQGTQWPLFAWLLVSVILLRTFLTIVVIPHNAMGAEITDNYSERTSFVSFRTNMTWIAGMILPVILLPTLFATSGDNDGRFVANNYIYYGWICCGLIITFGFICIKGTWHFIPRLKSIEKPNQFSGSFSGLIENCIDTFKNRNFRRLIIIDLTLGAVIGINAALYMVTMTYFWEVNSETLSLLATSSLLAAAIVFPATNTLSSYWEKQTLLKLSLLGLLLNTPWLVVARLMDMAPENGSFALLILLYIQATLLTLFSILRTISHHSILADIADEYELQTGCRQEGVIFALSTFAEKFVMGFGYIVVGPFLDIIGLNSEMAPGEVNESVLNSIGFLIGPVMAIILLIPYYISSYLNVSREHAANIRSQLKQRDSI